MNSVNYNLADRLFRTCSTQRLAAGGVGWKGSLSYSELNALAQRLASWPRAGPPRPRGFVGILASRSIMAYAGVLGTGWAGDADVPIHPKLPEERLIELLQITNPVALVADQQDSGALTERVRPRRGGTNPHPLRRFARHDPGDRPKKMDSEETAYMIFTSGSTGVPKGVLVPVRAVANLLSSLQSLYGFKPEDRFSKAYNLNFDGSVHDMFATWKRREPRSIPCPPPN